MDLRVLRLALLCIALLSGLTVGGLLRAQEDDAEARVSDAMAHLSARLGEEVTRETALYQWEEVIFPNRALGCPVPDTTYQREDVRGFRISIETSDATYDYRASTDGAILILCRDGLPDPTSVGIEVPEDILDAVSGWWALVYAAQGETFHWLNAEGEQASLARPRLPDEADGAAPQMRFSRDGRYMILTATLNSGQEGVGIYDFETQAFLQTHQAQPDERVFLGHPFMTSSPDSTRMAVGLATITDNPATPGDWRVIVFDLTTGDAVAQLQHSDPAFIDFTATLGYLPPLGAYYPHIMFYETTADNRDLVHLQFRSFGDPASVAPAIGWLPDADSAEPIIGSPYSVTVMDFLPSTGEGLFAYHDPELESLAGLAFFSDFNAIGRGTPSDVTQVYTNPERFHASPHWAAGGEMIVFTATNADFVERRFWLRLDGLNPVALEPGAQEYVGTPDGFLYTAAGGGVYYSPQENPVEAVQVFETTDGSPVRLVWSLGADTRFGVPRLVADGS